jgi:DNA-binding Lrp family transcriptional regulator
MTATMLPDRTDLAILGALQDDIPLIARPFAAIAGRLGITEQEVLERTARLRDAGIVRGISPILDSRHMGLSAATLIALHVPEDRIRNVAEVISSCPFVSHNFRRDNYYSLWFTLAADSEESLCHILAELLQRAGIPEKDALNLPTVQQLKIDVRFPFATHEEEDARGPA